MKISNTIVNRRVKENFHNLTEILLSYANSTEEHITMFKIINSIEKQNGISETGVKELIFILVDGIKYGNWPWNKITFNN